MSGMRLSHSYVAFDNLVKTYKNKLLLFTP
jgi:hypothetical protein